MNLESEEDLRQNLCIAEVQEEVWTQKKSLTGFFYKSIQESKNLEDKAFRILRCAKGWKKQNLTNVPGNEDSVRSQGQSRRELEE